MSHTEIAIIALFAVIGALLGSAMGLAFTNLERRRRRGRLLARRKEPPIHVPPITPGYPARWVEVNGFRYVLDTCGCGKPKGSAHVECEAEVTQP